MTTEQDYLWFRDELLVAVADEQEPPGLVEVDLFEIARAKGIRFQESWIHVVGKDWEKLGLGQDRSTLKNRRFLMNGPGLARASEIRRERRPKTIGQRIHGANWTMWGVIVAALALVAYILLEWFKR